MAAFGLGLATAAFMVFQAKAAYAEQPAHTQWASAFGHAMVPWMIGAVVAGIKAGYAAMRKREHNAINSLLWATGVALAFVVASSVYAQSKASPEAVYDEAARNDAMALMGAAFWVPGVAAYCNHYVEPNAELVSAASEWNARHEVAMVKTIQVIEMHGGLSAEEKEVIDRLAMSLLEQEVEQQADKKAYCATVAAALREGRLDLDQRADTADKLKRIMATPTQ